MLAGLPFQFAALRIQTGQFSLNAQQLVFAECLDVVLKSLQAHCGFLQAQVALLD